MKVTDFTFLLANPAKVANPLQTKQLEDIIAEYPYFQAARALHLKGLKNLHSYKYNKALKTTAAYTADRDVLFDFITSKDFLAYDAAPSLSNTTVLPQEPEVKTPVAKKSLIENSEDKPLPQDKTDAEQILDPELFGVKKVVMPEDAPAKEISSPSDPDLDLDPEEDTQKKNLNGTDATNLQTMERETAENSLRIGEPLEFSTKERFSFGEWLQLANKKPLEKPLEKPAEKPIKKAVREENKTKKEVKTTKPIPAARKQKFDRIDKFIAQNPKIIPKNNIPVPSNVANSGVLDKNELMTETLARVYLEQKKYKKAIQSYKILSLKYPEKSGFFADRIKMVKKIQLENRDLK